MQFLRSKVFSALVFMVCGAMLLVYFNNDKKSSGIASPLIIIGKDNSSDASRADTIIVVTPLENEIELLSLPRDSKVAIACSAEKESSKLAHAYSIGAQRWASNGGGANCLKQTVNDLLNIKQSYTLEIELEDVAELVDLVGGVMLTPTVSFCHGSTCFSAGKAVTLNADSALGFLRHRSSFKTQDLQRILNGQQFLIALIKKIQQMSNLDKSRLVASMFTKVRTDYPKLKILEILDYKEVPLRTATLKGTSKKENNISYYILNKAEVAYYQALFRQRYYSSSSSS